MFLTRDMACTTAQEISRVHLIPQSHIKSFHKQISLAFGMVYSGITRDACIQKRSRSQGYSIFFFKKKKTHLTTQLPPAATGSQHELAAPGVSLWHFYGLLRRPLDTLHVHPDHRLCRHSGSRQASTLEFLCRTHTLNIRASKVKPSPSCKLSAAHPQYEHHNKGSFSY